MKPTQPTQFQLFWKAHKKVADLNHAFMDAVKDGMTAQELRELIKRRPDIYSRFSHWIEKLP